MIEIEKPKIETVEISDDAKYGKFVVEPLERGYVQLWVTPYVVSYYPHSQVQLSHRFKSMEYFMSSQQLKAS
ncbi:DNA-directed RNA polymerase alpha subunit [Mesobacillus boroniphilus JCM 21738]|uniref:DNA-directed RNA polymerase alpha subunit n=1 Tax=Mesobacillus boroniphilus JCM 21738 TaxID=1294265 RepID=W4RT38_9BACI|nr:DNA-directed RNA polymerase alpha subunit [Mesobacillus boroniphilus JCM 21738]